MLPNRNIWTVLPRVRCRKEPQSQAPLCEREVREHLEAGARLYLLAMALEHPLVVALAPGIS